MSSVSKSSGARKKSANDRRILNKAAREEQGKMPSAKDFQRAAKYSGIPTVTIAEPEFRAVIARMKELTHVAIRAWVHNEDIERFLVELHETRCHLELAGITGKKAVAS